MYSSHDQNKCSSVTVEVSLSLGDWDCTDLFTHISSLCWCSFALLSNDYSCLYSLGLNKAVESVLLTSTDHKACGGVLVHLRSISGDLVYI